MGGVGGVGGAGGAGAAGGVGAVGVAAGASAGTSVASTGPVNTPAAVINISPQGFSTNFLSEVSAIDNSFKTLTDQLVAAAVLDALDDDKDDKNNGVVSALVAAAAIQAYNNIAGIQSGVSSTAVPGTGVSISISA